MTAPQVLGNFDRRLTQDYRIRGYLIDHLADLCGQDDSNSEHALQLVLDLLANEHTILPTKRSAIDGTLGRLVPLLSPTEQTNFAIDCLQHHRQARRRIGLKVLAAHFLPEHKKLLLDCFNRFRDSRALTLLTRVDADISEVAEDILRNTSDIYEQARVFGKLIELDLQRALQLAEHHPIAFVWGAGRARCSEALPMVLKILHGRYDDFANLSLVVWALGRLGARGPLQQLADSYSVALPTRGDGS